MFTCDNNFATNIVKALGLIHRLFTITPSIVAPVFCLCENTLKTLNCQKQSQSCREYVFVTRQPELFALIFILFLSVFSRYLLYDFQFMNFSELVTFPNRGLRIKTPGWERA